MDHPSDTPAPSISIREVTKRFGGFVAVDRVSLEIHRGEFFSLLGPSGCGKTTLLRMIAGLEKPSEGRLFLAGRDVTDIPSYRRPVNLVFQHFALFPHLTVEKNIAFGLRYQDVPRSEYASRIGTSLDLVQLSGLGRRYPNELSGGQKQRVALARALVLRPQVLLLDEPLGALDQKLRKEMQVELKNIQRDLGITFVFVTHDQEEAMTMSDRIAVMNNGLVEQCDAAEKVFEYPRTEFVAGFVGAANFFRGVVKSVDAEHARVTAAAGFEIVLPTRGRRVTPNQNIRFLIRPEKLALRDRGMPATIEQRVYQGLSTVYSLRNVAGETFTLYEQNAKPFNATSAKVGDKVHVGWDSDHAVLLESGAA